MRLKLEPYEEERVRLVKHALNEVYTKHNKKHDVSIESLMNILLLLFQSPVALSLYKKEEGRFKNIFDTIRDPKLKKQFQHERAKYHFGKKLNAVLDKTTEKYLHKLKDQDYGILLFNITRNGNKEISFEIEENSTNNHNSKLLYKLWQRLKTGRYATEIKLINHISEILDNISSPIKDTSTRKEIDRSKINDKIDDKFLKKVEHSFDILFESIYKKIYNTPLISINSKVPANVFFYMRYYEKDNLRRAGYYNYKLRLILCKTQEKHIRKALELMRQTRKIEIRNSQNTDNLFSFPITHLKVEDGITKHDPFIIGVEKNEEYSIGSLRDQFWEILLSENGINIIINSLKEPFGEGMRSVVDPVMSSGLLYIRRKPYLKGGLDRISVNENVEQVKEEDVVLSEPKYIDVLRVVSTYYVMACASPEITHETFRMLITPTKISGSTVFCMTTATAQQDEEKIIKEHRSILSKKGKSGEELNKAISTKRKKMRERDSTWDTFFYFQHTISSLVTQKTRSALKIKYLELVEEIFKIAIANNTQKKEMKHKLLLDNFIMDINKHMVWLSRWYPYDVIQLEDYLPSKSANNNKLLIDDYSNSYVYFEIAKNPFFPKTDNHKYLSEESMSHHLKSALTKALRSYSGMEY